MSVIKIDRLNHLILAITVFCFMACSASQSAAADLDAFAANKMLARTMNLGNAHEMDVEGKEPGDMTLEAGFFKVIQQAGFTAIRLPAKFSAHAMQGAPYTIQPDFMARVAWAVNEATANGLAIIVDMHHYKELFKEPKSNKDRFLSMWQQIATHFKDAPPNVFFEILNEPTKKIEPLWNQYSSKALKIIRKTNLKRTVIVGPITQNNAWDLSALKLPKDEHLIVTFHNYAPHKFTHQGADWLTPIPPIGRKWPLAGPAIRAPWSMTHSNATVNFDDGKGFAFADVKAWAGVILQHSSDAAEFSKLKIKTNRSLSLYIRCFHRNSPEPKVNAIPITAGATQEITSENCGKTTPFNKLTIETATEKESEPFRIEQLELVSADGKIETFLSTEQENAVAAIVYAAKWGKDNHRPIFMGEFGTYEPGDLPSRVKWTAAVRAEAEKQGVSWAYWEFGTGFGAYDRTTKTWRQELLRALIP